MKMQLDSSIIYRVPQFSYTDTLLDRWAALKESIALSSPDFYDLIKDVKASELSELPKGIQQTIWKYFNRACFRATPYASFAGVGMCHVGPSNSSPVIISNSQILHKFRDWTTTKNIVFSFAEMIERDVSVLANHSYYKVRNDLRYVVQSEGNYELAEIPFDEALSNILNACKVPIRISELMQRFGEKNTVEFYDILEGMY